MPIKINWKDLQKRIINWKEVEKVMCNWVQIRPNTAPVDLLCFTGNNLYRQPEVSVWNNTGQTPTIQLEMSSDGTNWSDYTIWTDIRLWVGEKVYLRNKSTTPTAFSISKDDFYQIHVTWVDITGDLNYLLCKNSTTTLVWNYTFANLFWGYDNTWNITLPATTLTTGCYYGMFGGMDITNPPVLPATTLASYCYKEMFTGSWIVTPPQLPATTLAEECYAGMFKDCGSLTSLPSLPATSLDYFGACYEEMFYGCSNIKLSKTQTWEYQTPYRIPSSWTWSWTSALLTWNMFSGTGGTFTWESPYDDVYLNTTYYTSNTVI